MIEHITDYRAYAARTLPNALLTALLSASLWQLYPPITGFLSFLAPYIPIWALPLAMVFLTSFALWWRNREKKE